MDFLICASSYALDFGNETLILCRICKRQAMAHRKKVLLKVIILGDSGYGDALLKAGLSQRALVYQGWQDISDEPIRA